MTYNNPIAQHGLAHIERAGGCDLLTTNSLYSHYRLATAAVPSTLSPTVVIFLANEYTDVDCTESTG